jgi:hypothetical protein
MTREGPLASHVALKSAGARFTDPGPERPSTARPLTSWRRRGVQKEIVGSGGIAYEPIAELRRNHAHELEAKLILSSVVDGWNVSENIIVEKNLSAAEGVEFGYSVGVSRPIGTLASGTSCHFCPENFVAGVEAYGGLGSTVAFARDQQRHYVAPVVGWHVTDRSTMKASVGLGLTETSDRYVVRVGWSYELPIRGGK